MSRQGVCEAAQRHFVLAGRHGVIPGRLWLPARPTDARPLFLLGHGAGVDKDVFYISMLAGYINQVHGCPAVAIDAVRHGERADSPPVPDGVADTNDSPAWWSGWATDVMIDDWRQVIDAALERDGLCSGEVAYWGASMGTLFGLPLVAAEPRIRAACFGLMGSIGATSDRLLADASRIRIPVVYLRQLDDHKVPSREVERLFHAIASDDVVLRDNHGDHGDLPPSEAFASVDFLMERLT